MPREPDKIPRERIVTTERRRWTLEVLLPRDDIDELGRDDFLGPAFRLDLELNLHPAPSRAANAASGLRRRLRHRAADRPGDVRRVQLTDGAIHGRPLGHERLHRVRRIRGADGGAVRLDDDLRGRSDLRIDKTLDCGVVVVDRQRDAVVLDAADARHGALTEGSRRDLVRRDVQRDRRDIGRDIGPVEGDLGIREDELSQCDRPPLGRRGCVIHLSGHQAANRNQPST